MIKVEVDGKELLLATDLEIEAELIALIYRYRWQIELSFKWMKSILGNRHLMAESPDGTPQVENTVVKPRPVSAALKITGFSTHHRLAAVIMPNSSAPGSNIDR